MNNLAWKLFFSVIKFEFRSYQFYRRLQRVLFYTKVFVSCILGFLLYDFTQREINNTNGRLRVQLPTLPISKSIFFQQSGWRLVLSKGATFYLNPVIFWIYNTCYLVLFCEMMGKSKSLTMQELSKSSETLASVKFERLLIGYILKCKERLSISIVASISQHYFNTLCRQSVRLASLVDTFSWPLVKACVTKS